LSQADAVHFMKVKPSRPDTVVTPLRVATTSANGLPLPSDFRNNKNNLFVVAVSVGFGMIPLVAPNFFRQLPHALHPLLESGILLAAIVSVALNAFFNGLGSAEAAKADAAGPPPPPSLPDA
jgi:uncharacterized membrane protein